jgi:hypothetical protein
VSRDLAVNLVVALVTFGMMVGVIVYILSR